MRWSVPRELLWAIIIGLVVFVVGLWPSQYPYSQAPKVDSHQQTKDAVSRTDATNHEPAAAVNPAGDQLNQQRGEHAAETTILGIKPGEWLLGIVTWMLWLATARLVSGADKTAERQLRAYISILQGSFDFAPVGDGTMNLRANFNIRNDGKTPAYFVKSDTAIEFYPFPLTEDLPTPPPNRIAFSRTINPGQTIEGNTVRNFRMGRVSDDRALYVIIRVTYLDAFNVSRESLSCGYIAETVALFGGFMTGNNIRINFVYTDRHNQST